MSKKLLATELFSDLDDGDEAHALRHVCVGCAMSSPPVRGEQTLVSVKHRWRLSRTPDGQGGYLFEWRCPTCWTRHKERG